MELDSYVKKTSIRNNRPFLFEIDKTKMVFRRKVIEGIKNPFPTLSKRVKRVMLLHVGLKKNQSICLTLNFIYSHHTFS